MVYQLLAYTHEPNPVEPDLVGAEPIPGQMQPRPVHRPWQIRLRRMQHRAALPRGFLARTGLDLAPFLYAPGLEVFSADAPMQGWNRKNSLPKRCALRPTAVPGN